MDTFTAWMNSLNGIVWGPAMLVLILGTGLYLQLRLCGTAAGLARPRRRPEPAG
jgi:Na+/alanine symporter